MIEMSRSAWPETNVGSTVWAANAVDEAAIEFSPTNSGVTDVPVPAAVVRPIRIRAEQSVLFGASPGPTMIQSTSAITVEPGVIPMAVAAPVPAALANPDAVYLRVMSGLVGDENGAAVIGPVGYIIQRMRLPVESACRLLLDGDGREQAEVHA